MTTQSEQHSLLLSGYFGAMNIGDEAILYSTLSELASTTTDITVESVNPQLTEREHGIDAIPLLSQDPMTWLTRIREVDELVIGGGGLLEPKNTGKYSLMVLLADVFDTDVSWFCVGVSPPKNWVDRWAYRAIMANSGYISVRDNGSKMDLKRSGVESHIDIIPDPALDNTKLPICQTEVPSSYITVVVRGCDWNPLNVNRLSKSLDMIVKETSEKILLVPFEDRSEDWNVITELEAAMNGNTEIYSGDISVGTMNYVIANAELVIGMRLHSIILAAANDIDFVTLSYSEKCYRVASQLGDKSPYDCSRFDENQLVDTALERYHNRDSTKSVGNNRTIQSDLVSERHAQSPADIFDRISLFGATLVANIWNFVTQR